MGQGAIAAGENSIALGNYTSAPSFAEIAVGSYNEDYTPNNTTGFDFDDRIFSIGNGNNGSRSNAITILKSGYIGLGTTYPTATLDISGTVKIVDGNQSLGKVLTSDANGNASWQPSSGGGGGGDFDWIITGNNMYSGVSGNVGINESSPSSSLDLVGSFQYTDGNQADGKVLTSDVNGNASWQPTNGSDDNDWTINGNNMYSGISGNVGVNQNNPTANLDIAGTLKFTDGNQAVGKVLTSDANGNASWQNPTGGTGGGDFDWIVNGNNMYSGVTGNVGINEINPSSSLDLVGSFQYTDGNQAVGKVLTSDASGNATWQPANGGGDNDWIINGNNMYSGVSGNTGVGTPSPTKKMDVSGELRVRNLPITNSSRDILTSDANGNVTKITNAKLLKDIYFDEATSSIAYFLTSTGSFTIDNIDLELTNTVTIPANTKASIVVNYSVPMGTNSHTTQVNGYFGVRFLRNSIEAPAGSRKFSIPLLYTSQVTQQYNSITMVSVSASFLEVVDNSANSSPLTITYSLNGYLEQGYSSGPTTFKFNMWASSGDNFNWGKGFLSTQLYLHN